MSSPLRFGVLGAAKIAPKALTQPAQQGPEAVVVCVAARDEERARQFAAENGIPKVHRDYAAVIADPEVDAIYNPLPMNLHAAWSIAAMRAGKHVLCEKPFAANAAEAREMVQVAKETGRFLLEAFHYRYHPMFERVLSIVRSGQLGRLQRLEGTFRVAIKDKNDLRHRYDTAGGATMDLGCYPLHQMRTVVGAEPRVVSAFARQGAPYVDVYMQTELEFPGGLPARMITSMEDHEPFSNALTIEGERGRVFVNNPLAPQIGHEVVTEIDGQREAFQVNGNGDTTYRCQLIAFVDAVRTGRQLPTMGEDSIAQMQLIDDVYRAAGLPPRGTAL
jgi:predicted dehydrogenase